VTWINREQRVIGLEVAEQLRREIAEKHEGALAMAPDRTTLGEAAELGLRHYATQPRRRAGNGGKRVEPSSWDEAARTVEYVVPALGSETPFARITASDLFRFVDERRNLRTNVPVSDGTKERMVEIRTTRVRTKGGAIAERPRWLSVHDPDHWRSSDLLWLLAYTGCSWSEAAGLRSSDGRVDHLKPVQVWPRTAHEPRNHGKAMARVPRDIPVIARLRPVLDRLSSYSRCGYLLSGPDGQPLRYETWRNRLAAAARATGHDTVTTHVLRHTAASLWIKAGAAPFLVMKAGGWASLAMVSKVYGHLWPSDVVELGRKGDALDWAALD
jgi:hypothetical protein